MKRLQRLPVFLRHSPSPWKKSPGAWSRYPLWYSTTPPPRKNLPPAVQSFSSRYKSWKSFYQNSNYKVFSEGNFFDYAIPPSPGPFGPGDFFAYIEYPSQSVRYLLVYTLTKAFQTCAPLARHNSLGLLPQPR